MEDYEALKLMSVSFTMGYAQSKIDFGELSLYISLSQAYKMYGRKMVTQWIKNKAIEPVFVRQMIKTFLSLAQQRIRQR